MATDDIRNLFARITSITLHVSEDELVEHDVNIIHKLINHAWDKVKAEKGSFVGHFMTAACAAFGERYHIPSVEQADQIDGLIELWVDFSSGKPGLSKTGLEMAHGIYDHFKGGVYLTQRVGSFASGEGEPTIEYLSMIFATTHFRLCWQWDEIVKWPDGKYRSRFVYRGKDLYSPPPAFKVPTPKLPYDG